MLLLAAMIIYLNGCGGGGSSTAAPAQQSPGGPTQQALDLAHAQKVYEGTPRTPPGFYADPLPTGVTGTVATVHLKNSDLAGAAPTAPAFELCHDDLAQATAWSEGKAVFMGSYSDLVDVAGTSRYWELTRVPRADVTARLRHRVFKCSYVDRSLLDGQNDSGPAGVVNLRPLDAAALQQLSEYLWQFTLFNNADHVVLDSANAAAATGMLAHAITMLRLTRATTAGECDRIEQLRWTHTADAATGALTRTLDVVRSFRARRVNSIVEICSG